MRKFADAIGKIGAGLIIVCIAAILAIVFIVQANTIYATDVAIRENAPNLLSERGRDAYELLLRNDWASFVELFDIKPTYYVVGNQANLSIVSDNFDEAIFVMAGNRRNGRVQAIRIDGNGTQVAPFNTNEHCTIIVWPYSGKVLTFSPTAAAYLCQILDQLCD